MSEQGGAWYAVIDCAQDERLLGLVQACSRKVCLFKGKIAPELEAAAPWLVQITDGDPLMPTWQAHGKGGSWGIMIQSDLPLEGLRGHLRKFLQAKLPDGMIATFRFYDPRVFNTYIRAATSQEREPWFNGVHQYAVEDQSGASLQHYHLNGATLMNGAQVLG